MSNRRFAFLLLWGAAFLAGCATPPKPIVTAFELVPRAAPAALRSECVATNIVPGLPADRAGIKEGDVIVRINGEVPAAWEGALDARLSSRTAVMVDVVRQGQPLRVEAHPSESSDPPGISCARSGIEATSGEAALVFKGQAEMLVRAEIIGPVSFIWIRVRNRSTKALRISPGMFTASSGDWTVLDSIRFTDEVAYLQAVETAQRFAGATAPAYTPSSGKMLLNQVQRAGAFLAGPAAGIVSNVNLTDQVLEGYNRIVGAQYPSMRFGAAGGAPARREAIRRWVPSSGRRDSDIAVAATELVTRPAFTESVLAPGYAQEGYLAYEAPPALPLRLSVDLGPDQFTLLFDEKVFLMTAKELEAYAAGAPEAAPKQAILADGTLFSGEIRGFDGSAHAFKVETDKDGKPVKGKLAVSTIGLLRIAGRNTIVVSDAKMPEVPKGAAKKTKKSEETP